MDNTFELKKGKIVFEEDKIVITDNAKYLKRSRLFSSGLLFLLGLYNLMNFVKHNDTHELWTGLLIGIAGLVLIVTAVLTNVDNEIFLKDVKSMKVKRILFKDYFFIKLKNNRTRNVVGIYNAERLEEYLKTIPLPK
jgi:hypothetical protein